MKLQQQLQHKIFNDRESLVRQVKNWQAAGEKVIFTNGCFDLLHRGHTEYLTCARDLGQKLVVALNTDASVSRLKGPHRPIQDETSRLHIMSALACIDAVILFPEDTPLELITLLQPDILVKGGDYKVEEIVGYAVVTAKGGQVLTLPFLPGYSTSAIEARIKAG